MKLPKFLEPYSNLPRSIYILFLVRVINSMGSFVFPLLTLFLTDRLGLGAKEAGAFVSLSTMSYVPGGLLGGKLSDIFGRKKVMIISQGLAALSFIPCAFLGKSMVIPWLLILAGVLNGAAQPANSAMVADLTNSKNRKAAFSLLYMGINIGFSVGPLIAGFLYKKYLPFTFLGNAAAIFIAITLLMLFVEETKPSYRNISDEIPEEEKAQEGSVFSVLLKRPSVLIYALLSSLYSFAYSQGNFSTTLQLRQLYGDNASTLMGGIFFTNGIVVVTMTTIIVYLTKKNKPLFNIALAGIFFACGFGMLYFINAYPLYIFSTVVWTIGEILNATNSGVYIADHAPSSHRGRFNSILTIITGAGSAVGPYIMGGYIQRFGVRLVWPLVFAITIFSAILMYTLNLNEVKKQKLIKVKTG